MSSAQFHATVHCLLLFGNNMNVQFAALTVLQTTAFGMTLRRKNIIIQHQGFVSYGIVLVLGMIVIINDLIRHKILYQTIFISNTTALCRFEFNINKYLLWAVVSFVFNTTKNDNQNSFFGKILLLDGRTAWQRLALSSTVLLLAGAIYRQRHEQNINL
jgi:hypothetical protein